MVVGDQLTDDRRVLLLDQPLPHQPQPFLVQLGQVLGLLDLDVRQRQLARLDHPRLLAQHERGVSGAGGALGQVLQCADDHGVLRRPAVLFAVQKGVDARRLIASLGQALRQPHALVPIDHVARAVVGLPHHHEPRG